MVAVERVAEAYLLAVAVEKRKALGAVARSWRRMSPDLDASWPAVQRSVASVTVGAQLEVGSMALDYSAEATSAAYVTAKPAAYLPDVSEWAGVAGDGRTVAGLSVGALVTTKEAFGAGATNSQALEAGGKWLTKAMGTVIADTQRGVEQVGFVGRGVGRFARMLTPPSCGRCIILAGKTYRSDVAFERHPGCDCVNIPAPEAIAGDLTVSPGDYLDSLDDGELAKALGSKANAQAYKDGADTNQLINAYRRKGAVQKAQNIRFTTEGATRRGWAYRSMAAGGVTGRIRLMPATIYELANDRADAARLLRLYGWII